MEIITGVECRRRWRVEDKLRIVAEAEAPGAVVSHVARRHQVSRGLLTNWRQQARRGALLAEHHAPVFIPVQMLPEPFPSLPAPTLPGPRGAPEPAGRDRRIEIALPDGTCIRVGADVGLATLRRVIAAVRRWSRFPRPSGFGSRWGTPTCGAA